MMMEMEEDFSKRDPGEVLAKCVGDYLSEDLDRTVLTGIEDNAAATSCVNLVNKHNDETFDVYNGVCIDTGCRFTVCGLRQYNAFLRSNATKHTALVSPPRRFEFWKNIVASLGTATISFQTTCGELLAYGTDVIQLKVPELFGLLLMRVANADVLEYSMQLRFPTWSVDLWEN
jgi:hypothetical protein